MKYYLYISETKINMLYSQIPQGLLSKLSAEIKFDIPPLSVLFKDKDKIPQEDIYARLNIVIKSIVDKGLVSPSFDMPYISNYLNMRWAEIDNSLVYFTHDSDKLLLGLGGSAYHILGRNGEGTSKLDPISRSNDYRIISGLNNLVIKSTNSDELLLETLLTEEQVKHSFYAIEKASRHIVGPEYKMEFMARILGKGESAKGQKIVLATPLYVAYSDD